MTNFDRDQYRAFADRRSSRIPTHALRVGFRPSRRDVVRIGALSALGLGLSDWFTLRSAAAPSPNAKSAKKCILIWLDGGPSHIDTFDPKPEAPAEVRGPFGTIPTTVPGMQICELLPRTAKVADKLAIVRSITSTLGEHNFGSHYMLTGYKPTPVLKYPSYGAVVAHQSPAGAALPNYIVLPEMNGEAGEGFLPATCGPFVVGGDPARQDFRVRDLDSYPGIDAQRLGRRRDFLSAFDRFAQTSASSEESSSDDSFAQAYRLLSSPDAKRAFHLEDEPERTRARYGPRTIGQSCLLARRLVEAGVPFVTVTDRGWDTHEAIVNRLQEGYTGGSVGKVPSLDWAYASLLEDLAERGLLDETLVILMGEFGRTPRINTSGGRDHWPRVFSVVLAGGGIRGGQVLGASDAHGESPAEDAVLPEDLARTVYTLLGIDPDLQLYTPDGRPVSVNRGNRVIRELLA